MNKNKCTIFILLNLATSYCNNFLYTNSNQYFPASKTKFALFRNQIKTIPCHVCIHFSYKSETATLYFNQHTIFFLTFSSFPFKIFRQTNDLTSGTKKKKNLENISHMRIVNRSSTSFSRGTYPPHFHSHPLLR